jgi:hypothetical protein
MPIVKMPNGDQVSFPDDMPKEQIRDMIAKKFPVEAARASMSKQSQSLQGSFGKPKEERGNFTDPMRQGVTFGFSDEIDGVKGGVGRVLQGGDFGQGYNDGVTEARENLDNYRERHPIASTALEITGAVPTTLMGGAWLNGGKGLIGAVRGGATAGAIYGAGTDEGGVGDRVDGAGMGALLGAGTGALTHGATKAAQSAWRNMHQIPKAVKSVPGSKEIRDAAGDLINQVKKGDGVIKGENFKSGVARMGKDAAEMFADPENEKKALAKLAKIREVPDGDVHLGKVHAMRRSAQKITGGSDGELARRMVAQIDGLLEDANTPEAKKLIQGIEEYARGKRTQTIEKAMSKADNAASGFTKGIQNEMRKLLNSDKNLRGFNQTEQLLMKKLLDGGALNQMLEKAGSGANVFGAGVGGMTAGWAGFLTVPIVSGLVKKLNARGARKAAELLAATVANGKAISVPAVRTNVVTPATVMGGHTAGLRNRLVE